MLTKVLTQVYWPVVWIYTALIVIFSIMYFTEMDSWTNRSHYNWMNFKRIIIPAMFLCVSLNVKHQGNQRMANIILYIPVGFSIFILIGGLFILFLYSKSNG